MLQTFFKTKNMKKKHNLLFNCNCNEPVLFTCNFHEQKETWAERKRNEILRKLIRRKVFWNDVFLFMIKTIASLIIIATIIFIFDLIALYLISDDFLCMFTVSFGLLGIVLIWFLILVVSNIISDNLEINYVKHKNTTYSMGWY
jgi:ABC-type multidrug transport system fused ATPase/permease subunit